MTVDTEPWLLGDRLSTRLPDGTTLLDDVTVSVGRRELVVVVGPSGAGKTTLLHTLAGLRAPTHGSVCVPRHGGGVVVGFVPQDDIVHGDLTLEATVRHAARLRLPADDLATLDAAVDRALEVLALGARRHLPVSRLSGGQRKRASIAVEIVAAPHVCFLDEPTSGLDPVAADSLMDVLRSLADSGTPVIMTSHHLPDLRVADRLVVMAAGGRVVFDGAPSDAPVHFGVDDMHGVCHVLASMPEQRSGTVAAAPAADVHAPFDTQRPRSAGAQWRILTRRNLELLGRNRMSLAIMAGSPVLVVLMFAVLFQPGVFDGQVDAVAARAVAYWISFAGFFFGLTFGLLQICTELAVVRRERVSSIDVGPYLAGKITVLVPALLVVNLVMVATLLALDRLPPLTPWRAAALLAVLGLDSLAGLALGLLASAAVDNSAQAALALPMLCFPAVLFSGAVLPVGSMTSTGQVIAATVSDRWAFDAVNRTLGLEAGSSISRLVVLAAMSLLLLGAAHVVVARRTRRAS